MISDYVMPKLAMAMNEGTINEWLVADGAPVAKGSPSWWWRPKRSPTM